MNNKGFTLVEMLAVVVILAIISGIAVNGVLSYINTSKKKSEEIFITKLEGYIENYINYYGSNIAVLPNKTYEFDKCRRTNNDGECISNTQDGTIEKDTATAVKLTGFNLLAITTADVKLVENNDLINPANKKKCFASKNPEVIVFKDSDFVYYYYLDLKGNNDCDITENTIITNIPKKLCEAIIGDETIQCTS